MTEYLHIKLDYIQINNKTKLSNVMCDSEIVMSGM